MPSRERGPAFRFVTVSFAAVTVLLILILIYDTGRLKGVLEAEHDRNSEIYARHAQGSIEEQCLLPQPEAMAECIEEVTLAAREHERAENDLIAQKEMALWAFWMLIVASITAAITRVGVFYVRSTLVQAGETNRAAVAAAEAANEANLIMRSEARPWVSLDQTIRCEFIHEPGSDRCNIWWEFTLTNKGRMPAHDVSLVWDVYRYDWSYIGAGRQGVENVARRAKRERNFDIPIFFPSEHTTRDTYGGSRVEGDDKGTLFLCVAVAYFLDPERREQGLTAQVFVLESDEGRPGPFAFKLLKVVARGYTLIE